MDWTILWWVLAVLLVIAGLAGTVVPALPGVPLVLAGLFIGAWVGDFSAVGWVTLGIFILLTIVAQVVDFLASAFGTRYAGAGARAFWGATLGAIVGIFFGIPGMVLGPFAGAVLGEISGRQYAPVIARRPGCLAGNGGRHAIKLAIAFLMVGIFISSWGFRAL
jgi:uncharacterized protein YqgC (DUF456 family)